MNYKLKFKKVEGKNVDFTLDDIPAGITILSSSNYVLFLQSMELEAQAYPISCIPDPFTNDIAEQINFLNTQKESILTQHFSTCVIDHMEDIEGQIIPDTDRFIIAFHDANVCQYNNNFYRFVLLKIKQIPTCFINEKFIMISLLSNITFIYDRPIVQPDFFPFQALCNLDLEQITHEKIDIFKYNPFGKPGDYLVYLTPISK